MTDAVTNDGGNAGESAVGAGLKPEATRADAAFLTLGAKAKPSNLGVRSSRLRVIPVDELVLHDRPSTGAILEAVRLISYSPSTSSGLQEVADWLVRVSQIGAEGS